MWISIQQDDLLASERQFPCDMGPTASLYPQGEWYGIKDEAAVIRLVDERLVAGRALPELRIDGQGGE